MIDSLQINRFRAFDSFRMEGFTRVNLLVGKNNSGKTSVLEAIELLLGGHRMLWDIPLRRGERFMATRSEKEAADIGHLFHGHRIAPQIEFAIEAIVNGASRSARCSIRTAYSFDPKNVLLPAALPEIGDPVLVLVLDRQGEGIPSQKVPPRIPIASSGKMPHAIFDEGAPGKPVHFVGIGEMTELRYAELWNDIVLTPEESKVVEALRIIEPRLERLAALSLATQSGAFGMRIKLAGSDMPAPLASLGDGMKRLLGLALHLVVSKNGYLLVDEIDTGLHYSVMKDVWRLVIETARRLDVQVFATTHSYDCLIALANVLRKHTDLQGDVSLHRIEAGRDRSTVFTAEDMIVAAEQEMELR